MKRTGFRPIDTRRVVRASLQFTQRLQTRQDRNIVFGAWSPEKYSNYHQSPRHTIVKQSRVVVGQVVQVQHAVAGH